MIVRPASAPSLADSMERATEVRTFSELLAHLRAHYPFWSPTEANVTIRPYGYDERIKWSTYLICVDGNAALFSNGPLEGS